METITKTFQGELIVLTTRTYVPIPVDNEVFKTTPNAAGQVHFTLSPITYTPTCKIPVSIHELICFRCFGSRSYYDKYEECGWCHGSHRVAYRVVRTSFTN